MKILIRDVSRHLYLSAGGSWVKSMNEARGFALGTAAIEHIKRTGLTGVELFCVFRNITFNTAIPVSAYGPPVPQSNDAASGDNPASSKPVRVLLVEDNPDDVQLIGNILRQELGCIVSLAFTADLFEAELDYKRPDVIVSDSSVRGMNWISALRLAREKYPDVPFVFCTGNPSPEKREAALALGAAAWTSKDECFRELVQVIMRLTANRR